MPRLTQAGQIIITPNTEPRSLSDLVNFTQKSNLAESQLGALSSNWEQALRTVNRYFGTSQVYKEACAKYTCSGGSPVSRDVEIATITGFVSGAGPAGVGVNPTTNRVYVANQGTGSLSVIDANTNLVLTTIPVASANQAIGVGVNPTNNLVYMGGLTSNNVYVINGTTNTVLTSIAIGAPAIPYGVAVNSATNRIYITNDASPTVSVINGTSNKVLTTITVGTTPLGVAVNPTTNRVYVTNFGDSTLSVINGTSNKVLTTFSVATGPLGVGVDPIANRIYVAGVVTGVVSAIDGNTNAVTTIPICGGPCLVGQFGTGLFGVAVNPAAHRVYVANQGGNSVSVINGTSSSILNTITVGANPRFLETNPTTGRVYVANWVENSVSVIGQREEIREACLQALTPACLVVSSTGTLFPGTPQAVSVNLVAVSLVTNETSTGTLVALTVTCDNNTANPNQQCSALYVDGNIWGPSLTDLSKSPFIIQNAEPYFYLQFHWWDFANSRIAKWGTWWYGTASIPNWYWGVYWWWRTYVNYYIGIPYVPWWWWTWHWTYWRYWAWWGTAFQT
jgi:YVTN family beta-propeller protein